MTKEKEIVLFETYQMKYYNLDIIISVGYRVKSNRGVECCRWANSVLKQYILQGYAINQRRIQHLDEGIRIMNHSFCDGNKKTPDQVASATGQVFLVFTYSTDKLLLRKAS